MTTDRDKSIERLLRRPLSSDRQAPDHCPDAETLAALADDTLTAPARRDLESHVADCHRCQALTAAMVRAESSSGATADGAAAGMPWWKGRALKWLVPATAAATAVALWVAVPGQRTPLSEEATLESQIAAAPPAASPEVPRSDALPPPADARANSSPAREREADVGFERAAPAAPPASVPPQASLKSEESLSSKSPVAGSLPPSREASASAEASADKSVDRRQASAPEPPNEIARRENAPPQQERTLNQPAAPLAQARAAADAAGARAAAGFDVVSPNPRIRWRVGPGLSVQYSADDGATWVMQQTGASAELIAGSAPTPEVCWLVGRGGLVLRTTDAGRQWQRTAFPETVDLTAVTASTALNASVSLADGRRFATTDGGRTWALVR